MQIIRPKAFCRCKRLKQIHIPASITTIDKKAFDECLSLEMITVNENNISFRSLAGITLKAKVPPQCTDYTFDSQSYKSATLYIPAGTKAEYTSAPVWRNFKNIVEVDLSAKEPQ